MGYYTAIHFDGKLKRNIPEHVIKTLKYMLDAYATLETSRDQIPFPLNEDGNPSPLAHTDRWNSLFVMSSAYFHAETESYMQQVRDDTYLHVVANLKNYDDEIEKFMCWIAPFIEAEANSWIGFALTEDDWVTEYYVDSENHIYTTSPDGEYDPYSRGSGNEIELIDEWDKYVEENINPYVNQSEYDIVGNRKE